jgi:diketogulonate reductase-like aldo/keto reductase
MKIPELALADGHKIPQIGLGLWGVTDDQDFFSAFDAAIESGYRLFDSAQHYKNEKQLGAAVKKSSVRRSQLFITTKIGVSSFGYKKTISSFDESMEKLDMEYVDLLLLHFPVSLLRKKSWKALEELKDSGRVKSIGVSNYTIRHLEEMKKYAKVMPVVNQVELHVFLQQPELIDYCNQNNIAVEAYSPLAHGKVMDDPVIQRLAKKYKKSYAQIMLRFLVELGLVVIPKSVTPKRIQENIKIFDFKFDDDDLKQLKSSDRDLRTCWNPTLVP